MAIFFIVSLICALLIPGAFLYFAAQMVVGPLLWAGRGLRLGANHQRLLGPGRAIALTPTSDAEFRRLLDQMALTALSKRARDFVGTHEGVQVLVRTQPRTVGPYGEPLRFPWTQKERSEAQQVLGLQVVLDTRQRLPASLDLHVALGRGDSVVGDEALAVALLDGGIRRWSSPGDQLTLSEGVLAYDSPLGVHRAQPDVLVTALARTTRRLLDATSPEGRVDCVALLLHNAANDDLPRVRADSVDMLLARFPSAAEPALAIALDDPHPDVRFAAARHMDSDGFDIVVDVLADPEASEGLRERAFRYLLRNFPSARVLPIVERVIREETSSLRQIALRHVGDTRHAPAIAWMAPLASTADPRTAVDMTHALVQIGTNAAEPVLWQLLDRPEVDVVAAAIDALGEVGDIASVTRLLALKRDRSEARIFREIANAVLMIQARQARTGAGALSVVNAPDRGQLSMPAEAGTVSVADPVPDADRPEAHDDRGDER